MMLQVPNVPDISVPEGTSDENNQEIKVWPASTQGGGEKLFLILNRKTMSKL